MSPSLEYFNGVRLVKREILRLEERGALVEKITPDSRELGFNRYIIVSGWKVDLEMIYVGKTITASNLFEIYYTYPCAALSYIAEEGTRINSTRPERLSAFSFIENK